MEAFIRGHEDKTEAAEPSRPTTAPVKVNALARETSRAIAEEDASRVTLIPTEEH
jgi:hypothetical protein